MADAVHRIKRMMVGYDGMFIALVTPGHTYRWPTMARKQAAAGVRISIKMPRQEVKRIADRLERMLQKVAESTEAVKEGNTP